MWLRTQDLHLLYFHILIRFLAAKVIGASARFRQMHIFYVLPLFAIMFTLETEYKRWIFILGILLESWYNLEKQSNTISQ